jgi:hypothetical protein
LLFYKPTQKICRNNREGSGSLVHSWQNEFMWLAESVTLGNYCICSLTEMKTLPLPV